MIAPEVRTAKNTEIPCLVLKKGLVDNPRLHTFSSQKPNGFNRKEFLELRSLHSSYIQHMLTK